MNQRTECFGYLVHEKDRPGKLNTEKLKAQRILPCESYGILKQMKHVPLENGTVLKWHDYLGPKIAGKKFAYVTDTSYSNNIEKLIEGVDLLLIESTYREDQKELADKYFHLTSKAAIDMATKCSVKKVMLTHFSSRYVAAKELLKDLQISGKHPEIFLAEDGMEINI